MSKNKLDTIVPAFFRDECGLIINDSFADFLLNNDRDRGPLSLGCRYVVNYRLIKDEENKYEKVIYDKLLDKYIEDFFEMVKIMEADDPDSGFVKERCKDMKATINHDMTCDIMNMQYRARQIASLALYKKIFNESTMILSDDTTEINMINSQLKLVAKKIYPKFNKVLDDPDNTGKIIVDKMVTDEESAINLAKNISTDTVITLVDPSEALDAFYMHAFETLYNNRPEKFGTTFAGFYKLNKYV